MHFCSSNHSFSLFWHELGRNHSGSVKSCVLTTNLAGTWSVLVINLLFISCPNLIFYEDSNLQPQQKSKPFSIPPEIILCVLLQMLLGKTRPYPVNSDLEIQIADLDVKQSLGKPPLTQQV